jgi:ABC-type glycerol-3-phosphate transport system substrate-binding protein
LAVTTADPARQQAAAAWLAWLLTPDRLSAWSQAAGWLPASPQGWQTWGDNPYHTFLQSQLKVAVPSPIGFSDSTVAAQLQKAQAAVVRDGANPNDVTRNILTPVPR